MASEYLKWKYKDVRPEEKTPLTPAQRRANWWHYHKWWVAAGAVLLLAVCSFAWGKVQDWLNRPDYQVAYVGASYLPDDAARQVEESFAALAEDADGNGKIKVQLNQYVFSPTDPEMAESASVLLTADILSRESCLFILEDPQWFQEAFGALPQDAVPWQDTGLYLAAFDAVGPLWEKVTEGNP